MTTKGERFWLTMVGRGNQFLRGIVRRLTTEEIRNGIQFLRQATLALDQIQAEQAAGSGKRKR
jgi:hypothetical protein